MGKAPCQRDTGIPDDVLGLPRRPRVSQRNDEVQYMRAVHDALCAAGVVVWRNNCGVATYPSQRPGAYHAQARVRYGLGLGSADLVGLCRRLMQGTILRLVHPSLMSRMDLEAEVTSLRDRVSELESELAGVGRFVAVETKARTRQTPEQQAWQRAVEGAGGLYVLARAGVDSIADVVRRVTL